MYKRQLVHRGTSHPSIDANYFPNTSSNYYWSSDVYAPDPAVAWVVYFYYGDSGAYYLSSGSRVRLVRSGQ